MKYFLLLIALLGFSFSIYSQSKTQFYGTWEKVSKPTDSNITLKKINETDKTKKGFYIKFLQNNKVYSGILDYVRKCGNDTYSPKVGTWKLDKDGILLNFNQASINDYNKFKILQISYDTIILQKTMNN